MGPGRPSAPAGQLSTDCVKQRPGLRRLRETAGMTGKPVPLPDTLGAVFSRAEATAAGVSSRRLRCSDVERISHGLYRRTVGPLEHAHEQATSTHPAELRRTHQRNLAAAIAPTLSEGLFFCLNTAALLWSLPLPRGESEALDIGCWTPARGMRRPEVTTHEVRPHLARLSEVDGIPLTDPASTWAMLGAHLQLRDLVALGDAIIREPRIPGSSRRSSPLASVAQLDSAIGMGRRPGIRRLREALPLLSPHSASAPESHCRLILLRPGLPAPELDHDVYGADGILIGCSEFAYPEYRLAVEYEGGHHLYDPRQWDRDIEKYRHYSQIGWEVIRVTSDLLYRRPEGLRYQVGEALRRRGWRPGR